MRMNVSDVMLELQHRAYLEVRRDEGNWYTALEERKHRGMIRRALLRRDMGLRVKAFLEKEKSK